MAVDGWTKYGKRKGFGAKVSPGNRTPAAKHLRDYQFHRGKHKGKTWDQVYALDKDYLIWMESNEDAPKAFRNQLRTFLAIKGEFNGDPSRPEDAERYTNRELNQCLRRNQ